MAVLCASCFLIASNMGKRGSVDAILTAVNVQGKGREQLSWSRDREILCLRSVREKEVRAHMAVEAPRVSASNTGCQASEYGNYCDSSAADRIAGMPISTSSSDVHPRSGLVC
jgi:hypothetical protein